MISTNYTKPKNKYNNSYNNNNNNIPSNNKTTTTTTTTNNNNNNNNNINTNKLSVISDLDIERDLKIKKTYDNFYIEFPSLKEIYKSNNVKAKNIKKNLDTIKFKVNKNFKEICEKPFCNCNSKFLSCYCDQAKDRAAKSPELQKELDQLTEFHNESLKNSEDNWKKRDLLYYCFIQRDSEAQIIYEFINQVCLYYKITFESMLDIGCGLGRMFNEWENSSFDLIEAFEPDFDYFKFAHNYSKNTCNRVEVYQLGFLELNVSERYNLISSIHGPFQYLNNLEDRIKAMKNMYDALKPGGILLIDISNFLCGLSNILNNKQQRKMINGQSVIRTSNIKVDTFNSKWYVDDIFFSTDTNGVDDDRGQFGNGHLVVEELCFSIISKPELELLFKSSGFKNVRCASQWQFNSLLDDGKNINNQGHRIIMIGQK